MKSTKQNGGDLTRCRALFLNLIDICHRDTAGNNNIGQMFIFFLKITKFKIKRDRKMYNSTAIISEELTENKITLKRSDLLIWIRMMMKYQL